jgi:glycosyltransferase involved in cell wall biosynthesis
MKQVLIIVYYWPPSGGAGVQRWLKFTRYLPEFGIKPTVITTRDGDYPAIDHSLEAEIPADVQVIRTFTPSFSGWYKRLVGKGNAVPYGTMQPGRDASLLKRVSFWLRRNCVIPDMRRIWNPWAYRAAAAQLRSSHYDAIITTGPPHSTHLVGLKLKRRFGIPWLADFRDPWSEIDYLRGTSRLMLTEMLDRRLEQKVVRRADAITAPTRSILQSLQVADGILLYNGFDEADFANLTPQKTGEAFCLHYFGVISPERTPLPVLHALELVLQQHPDWQVELHFWGNVAQEVRADIAAHPLHKLCHMHGYVTHQEVLQQMVSADMLLLIINDVPENEGIITGKVFEYLGSGRPVLALGPSQGEAAEILHHAKAGAMFDYCDIEAMAKYIMHNFQSADNQTTDSSTATARYSRRTLTQNLAKVLHSL